MAATLKDFENTDVYSRPTVCTVCGGNMIFKGVGEYQCEKCGSLDYDDYGKVRNYIETHPGTTAAQASEATGVKQKTIRTMLKDDRLEVAANSKVYITCEICGASIRFGRLCAQCEAARAKSESMRNTRRNHHIEGYSTEVPRGEDGAKRFRREI